jgi:DNA-binding NarL/FixJ family response regulator
LPSIRDRAATPRADQPAVSASDETLAGLTPRQREVLELIVAGKSNKEIARALNLGEGTVKVHLAALFRNLGVNNRAAAAAAGARLLSGRG